MPSVDYVKFIPRLAMAIVSSAPSSFHGASKLKICTSPLSTINSYFVEAGPTAREIVACRVVESASVDSGYETGRHCCRTNLNVVSFGGQRPPYEYYLSTDKDDKQYICVLCIFSLSSTTMPDDMIVGAVADCWVMVLLIRQCRCC